MKNCLNKGDDFAISLRRKKRMDKLNQKRFRVHGKLSKSKFLGESNFGKIKYIDMLAMRSLIDSISCMLSKSLSDESVYRITDFI